MGAQALLNLIDETRALFHRLKAVAEQVHQKGEATAGMRGVLLQLEAGPMTVVQMARWRPVSRQHIQKLVNALLKEKLVEKVRNPAHRRSYLVRLTAAGRKAAREMRRREEALFKSAKLSVPNTELNRTAEVLKSVREFFEGPEWQKHLQGEIV